MTCVVLFIGGSVGDIRGEIPLFFPLLQEVRCAYCVIIVAIYWMSEVMPLAATAMMPVFLFPLFDVVDSKTIAKEFITDTNFLFIGGLIVAIAVEKCNLHERIALKVLTIVGSQPKWIMLGFMTVTAFLSMWISNTATTAMMVPIAESVVRQLVRSYRISDQNDGKDEVIIALVDAEQLKQETAKNDAHDDLKDLSKRDSSIAKGLLISICFAANIGGTATITGTAPNLVMVGQLEELFKGANTGINYLSWIVFALPLMLLALFLCWLLLLAVFFRNSPPADQTITIMIQDRYRTLPPMSYAEKSVIFCFLTVLFLWVIRDPKFVPGFGAFFKKGHFTDATSAMIVAVLLFALPDRKPTWLCCQQNEDESQNGGTLMDWPTMQNRFPWSVVLLLGGGFAIASGVNASGLSATVGRVLSGLSDLPVFAIQFVCVVITMFITNICSNTVTASIFVPIVATLSQNLRLNPLALMLPTTLACSFAFVLPVATPPNAIVFAIGILRITDMMLVGLVMSLISSSIIVVYMTVYVNFVFPLDEFPQWANITTT